MEEDLLYKIGANTDKFDKAMGGVISTLKAGAIAFIGFGSAGAALKFVTDEALKNEKATMALASAVKSLQNGTEEGFLALNKYAESMSVVTGIADEDLKGALKNLVYATGDVTAAQKSLGAVVDLSRAKNISLEQASKIVGKAYEGNTAMLKRYGVQIDEHAKGMTVINELTKKFGGAEDSYLATTQGKLDIAKQAVNNLANELGQSLLPALTWAATAFTKFIQSFTGNEMEKSGLKKAIKETKIELAEDNIKLEEAIIKYGKNSHEVKDLKSVIKELNTELKEEEKNLGKINTELDKNAIKIFAAAKGTAEETATVEASDKDKLESAGMFFNGMAALSKTGNKQLFEIGKAASMANIIVSTAEAVMNAYAKIPPPFNIAAAIGVGTAGAVELGIASGAVFNPAGAAEGVWDWRARGNTETLITTLNHNEAIVTKPQARNMAGSTVNNYNFPMVIPDASAMDRVMREIIIPSQSRVNVAKGL